MTAMLEDIFDKDRGVHGVTVFLSNLLPKGKNNECVEKVNKDYKKIVEEYEEKNKKLEEKDRKKIVFVDINSKIKPEHMTDDGIHPNDAGHKIFAETWFEAIKANEGLITKPNDNKGITPAVPS